LKNKNRYIVIGLILLVLILDQWLKMWVKMNMALGEELYPLGENNTWFRIHFTENPGMAFGLKLGGASGKIILSVFRIIAVTFMGYYLHILLKQKMHFGLVISIAFIMAGALGNILDSAFYGFLFNKGTVLNETHDYWMGYHGIAEMSGSYAGFLQGCVVDMLYFPMYNGVFPEWLPIWGGRAVSFFRPVFNLADASITLGVFIIIFFQRRFFIEEKTTEKEAIATTEENTTEA
jgi:signal peptidase II